jgi:hypothetical protein
MNWQWIVFLIGSYIGGAYILRSMAQSAKPNKSHDYSGLAAAFLVSPIWVWFWVATAGIEQLFKGMGRWISGD